MKFGDFSFYIPDHDEDAEPYKEDGIMVICDGMGGAGNLECTIKGVTQTQAYFASRCVSSTVIEFLKENREAILGGEDDDSFAASLRERIIRDLYVFAKRNDVEFCDSVGGILRTLPTTLASMVYRPIESGTEIVCFWAGDSRCYCLDPSKGLIQLTPDDIPSYDRSEPPPNDTPMVNCINLTVDFRINVARYIMPSKCLLFAVSDGVYGYVPSPMDVECEFLPLGDDFDMEKQVFAVTKENTKDDATIVCTSIGIEDADEYRAMLGDRTAKVKEMADRVTAARNAMLDASARLSVAKKADMEVPENVAVLKATRAEYMENSKNLRVTVEELWKEYGVDYWPEECRRHPCTEPTPMEEICARISVDDEPMTFKRVRPRFEAEMLEEMFRSMSVADTCVPRFYDDHAECNVWEYKDGKNQKCRMRMRPVRNREDDARLADEILRKISRMKDRTRNEACHGGIDGNMLWMVTRYRKPAVNVKKMSLISAYRRGYSISTLVKALRRLHSENIVLGDVSYNTVLFDLRSDKGFKASVAGYLYASEADEEKIRYDVRCLGLMMVESYLGKILDGITDKELDSIISTAGAGDGKYLSIARDAIFGDVDSMDRVLALLKGN